MLVCLECFECCLNGYWLKKKKKCRRIALRRPLIIRSPLPDPKRESSQGFTPGEAWAVHFVLLFIGSTTTRANEGVFICRRCKPHYAFLDLHLLTEASPSERALDTVISCRARVGIRCRPRESIARRRRARYKIYSCHSWKCFCLSIHFWWLFLLLPYWPGRPLN